MKNQPRLVTIQPRASAKKDPIASVAIKSAARKSTISPADQKKITGSVRKPSRRARSFMPCPLIAALCRMPSVAGIRAAGKRRSRHRPRRTETARESGSRQAAASSPATRRTASS